MKCAKHKLGLKISQSNINMDLSIKMDTGSNQIVDIFIVLCFKMLLSFYYFSRILLYFSKTLTRQAVTPLWNAV